MLSGYMYRFLWVDLTEGKMREEIPDESLLMDFIGGYGVAARILYDHIPPKIDPLGPENILAVLTGPLTGTVAPTGTRWTIAAKSPLTGGWGDANGSGFFGVALKQAGYDAVFFSGIAPHPVYLLLDNGRAELKNAGSLWGFDSYQIEDWVKSELGKEFEAVCIGPAGEKQALISGIIHSKGRAAARSGLGAVMGSKRIKLIAARGMNEIPTADPNVVSNLKKKFVKEITSGVGFSNLYRETGTPGYTAVGARNGDSPIRNWGASVGAFPDADPLEYDELLKFRGKKKSCWKCPVSCWGTSRVLYNGEVVESHQPEYETASAFGTLILNNDYPSIIKANEICNRFGLDSISAGACIAFAIECFEHGIIGLNDTGGINLAWGDHLSMNRMLEKLARREDIGDILADGVKRAAERLGPAAEPFAIHCGGQELPMHDPRFEPGLGVIYKIDATPGRHTQASQFVFPAGLPTKSPVYGDNPSRQKKKGYWVKEASCLCHTMSVSGLCLFGYLSTHVLFTHEFLSAVTGRTFTFEDMLLTGERIANVRQAFNIREGINPVTQIIPSRPYGQPPLPDGPTAGITVHIDEMLEEYLTAMDWTLDAAIPRPATLSRLGLTDISRDLWG